MRIVVNDIAASKTGALSVLRDFYDWILKNEYDHEWIFVLGDKLLAEEGKIRVLVRDDVKSSRARRLEFDLKEGAGFFESLKPDLLFSMQNTLPRGYKGRQALYLHQPLPYQTWKKFSFLKAEEREYAVYQYLIGRMINGSVKRANKVIVQTEWMRDAVIKRTGIDADKVVKILPDIDVPTLNNTVIHNDVIKRFFYPAGEILYKNHACILEAVGILKERGLSDFEVAFTLKKGDIPGLNRYPEHEQVKYLGRIGRDEVFRRYINEILVFPSYIETFGYPPAEARAVGGRILASDCPFCHEVLDGYDRVKYFDPFKPEELADIMEGIISGKDGFAEDKSVKSAVNEEDHSSWEQVFETLINTAKAG